MQNISIPLHRQIQNLGDTGKKIIVDTAKIFIHITAAVSPIFLALGFSILFFCPREFTYFSYNMVLPAGGIVLFTSFLVSNIKNFIKLWQNQPSLPSGNLHAPTLLTPSQPQPSTSQPIFFQFSRDSSSLSSPQFF